MLTLPGPSCHPEPAKTAKDLTDSDGSTHTKLCDPLARAGSLGAAAKAALPRDDKIVNAIPNQSDPAAAEEKRSYLTLPSTMQALIPPKPNELLMT